MTGEQEKQERERWRFPDAAARAAISEAEPDKVLERIRTGQLGPLENAFLSAICERELQRMKRRVAVLNGAEVMLEAAGVKPAEDPDPDILERILDDAATIAHEADRQFHARLLAAELTTPGSVSKRLVGILGSMSWAEKAAFQMLVNRMLEREGTLGFIPELSYEATDLEKLVPRLEALGLISGQKAYEPSRSKPLPVQYHGTKLLITGPEIPRITITEIFGRQPVGPGLELYRALAKLELPNYINQLLDRPPDLHVPFKFRLAEDPKSGAAKPAKK